jgi:hypothetical protein
VREISHTEENERRRQERLAIAIGVIVGGCALPLLYFYLMTETLTPFTVRGWLSVAAVSLACIGTGTVFVRRNRRP